MKTIIIMIICILVFTSNCSDVYAYTLTFDEFPSGSAIDYADTYGVFASNFIAVDHTSSTWGTPHSGANVMMWNGDFTACPGIYFSKSQVRYDVYSVGAYFSTQPGVMIEITAYHINDTSHEITSVVIGAADQSWDNQYIEIDSSSGVFNYLTFLPLNSPNQLYGFCADDMTVIPVPEPSSILALSFGLVPVGVTVIRRRRK